MLRTFLLTLVGAAGLSYMAAWARSEPVDTQQNAAAVAQLTTDDEAGDDDQGVMIDISERGMPSDAEWEAMHEHARLAAQARSAEGASAGANSWNGSSGSMGGSGDGGFNGGMGRSGDGGSGSGDGGFNGGMGGSGDGGGGSGDGGFNGGMGVSGGGSGDGSFGSFKIASAMPPAAARASAYSGGLSDFKSSVITHMNTRYFAMNPDNGTLCSFGKMGKDQRYDRYGQIEGVEFAIDANQWKKRFVIDGKALAKLAGSRMLEFAGVGLEAELNQNNKIEVTFVGTAVPKAEVIHRLNQNVEALEYIDAVAQKRAAYDKKDFKLFAGEAPPHPKVVLANVIMLNGEFSKALDGCVDGKLHSRILNDGIELKVCKQDGEQMTLLSPVVRCYRTYSVEFKTDAGGRPAQVAMADRNGNQHQVPQVFDLTPDL